MVGKIGQLLLNGGGGGGGGQDGRSDLKNFFGQLNVYADVAVRT